MSSDKARSTAAVAQITVVVPTRNRPRFLTGLLNYLTFTRFPFRTVVLDAGDDESRPLVQKVVNERSRNLDLHYHRALFVDSDRSSIRFYKQIAELISSIDSPYVGILATRSLCR